MRHICGTDLKKIFRLGSALNLKDYLFDSGVFKARTGIVGGGEIEAHLSVLESARARDDGLCSHSNTPTQASSTHKFCCDLRLGLFPIPAHG